MLFSAQKNCNRFLSQLHQLNADANTKSAKNKPQQKLSWTWTCFETSAGHTNANNNPEQTYHIGDSSQVLPVQAKLMCCSESLSLFDAVLLGDVTSLNLRWPL